MLDWYLRTTDLLREMRGKAFDAWTHLNENNPEAARTVNGYIKRDLVELGRHWTAAGFDTVEFGSLGRHVRFGDVTDYRDITRFDIPSIEEHAARHAREAAPAVPVMGFEDLLHPVIAEGCLRQFRDGHLREAVLNSITAIMDLIRDRTKLKADGAALVSETFALERPHLVLSEIGSESGKNDQKGFLQIFQGAYIGIRNPKAHSLQHDLTPAKAAQYLVFASLLARRVAESHLMTGKPEKTAPG